MTISLNDAWTKMEEFVTRLGAEPEIKPVIERDGQRFSYYVDLNGHRVGLWVVGDSPRYSASVDGCLSLRMSNLTALDIVLAMLTERPEPWTGHEVWDDYEEAL